MAGRLRDSGMRSGQIFAGRLRLYDLKKEKYVELTVNASGNLELANMNSSSATVDLT